MKKKLTPVIIILILVAGFLVASFVGSSNYKLASLPKVAKASDTKSLAQQLIANDEFFSGGIEMKYTTLERHTVEVKVRNDMTGDDSVIAKEYVIKAVNNGSEWKMVENKIHWKCRGDIFGFWTTSTCS